jgi:hypothetical protein
VKVLSSFVILAGVVCCMFCNNWMYLLIEVKAGTDYHYLKKKSGQYQ